MKFNKALSYSSISVWQSCRRYWQNRYLLHLPEVSDMSYAIRGSLVHSVLENHYSDKYKDIEEAKKDFNERWNKSKLGFSILSKKKDETWLMCLHGIQHKLKPTHNEYKFYYEKPFYVGYADILNKDEGWIADYKTCASADNSHKHQMKYYAWAFHREFDKIPKVRVLFLKHGIKEIDYEFTEEEIKGVREEVDLVREQIETSIIDNNFPRCCKDFSTCNIWCPFKEVCRKEDFKEKEDLTYTLSIKGCYFYIDGFFNQVLERQLKKKFSYELKDAYFIKQKMPWANTTIRFYNEKYKSLPIGFLEGLKKTLTDFGAYMRKKTNIVIKDLRVFDETKVKMPEKLLKKELRKYQEDSVDAYLPKKIGIIEIATSGGKSLVIAEIIRRLGIRTLLLVNRLELVKQLRETIQEELGIEVGVIQGSNYNVKDITVATVQTISSKIKNKDDKIIPYLNSVRFSIIDECQNIGMNNSFIKVASELKNTEYRLLTSGTARRTDGNDMWINSIGGDICYKLNAEKLIDQGYIAKPDIKFIKDFMTKEEVKEAEQRCMKGLINETFKYQSTYKEFIVNNEKRNELIKSLVKKNKKTLILVKLVEHGELLSKLLGAPYFSGSTLKDDREYLLNKFKGDGLNCLIGTMSIFSEGINIERLEVLINASGNKSDIKSVQTLGRLLRKHKDKKTTEYYDFIDYPFLLSRISFERVKSFKKEGHDVEIKLR